MKRSEVCEKGLKHMKGFVSRSEGKCRRVRSHLGMLGGARLGRLGTCGLSALLFKGPNGPGRDGGGGAPLPAGLCPADILRGAVGLGGGDLRKQTETLTANIEEKHFHIYTPHYSGRKRVPLLLLPESFTEQSGSFHADLSSTTPGGSCVRKTLISL